MFDQTPKAKVVVDKATLPLQQPPIFPLSTQVLQAVRTPNFCRRPLRLDLTTTATNNGHTSEDSTLPGDPRPNKMVGPLPSISPSILGPHPSIIRAGPSSMNPQQSRTSFLHSIPAVKPPRVKTNASQEGKNKVTDQSKPTTLMPTKDILVALPTGATIGLHRDPPSAILRHLVESSCITLPPLKPYDPQTPKPSWFDDNLVCAYHQMPRHDTNSCKALRSLLHQLFITHTQPQPQPRPRPRPKDTLQTQMQTRPQPQPQPRPRPRPQNTLQTRMQTPPQ